MAQKALHQFFNVRSASQVQLKNETEAAPVTVDAASAALPASDAEGAPDGQQVTAAKARKTGRPTAAKSKQRKPSFASKVNALVLFTEGPVADAAAHAGAPSKKIVKGKASELLGAEASAESDQPASEGTSASTEAVIVASPAVVLGATPRCCKCRQEVDVLHVQLTGKKRIIEVQQLQHEARAIGEALWRLAQQSFPRVAGKPADCLLA